MCHVRCDYAITLIFVLFYVFYSPRNVCVPRKGDIYILTCLNSSNFTTE